MATKTYEQYLREAMREGYADYTDDPNAKAAFLHLESRGLIRVIEREGGAWRVSQDTEHMVKAREWLAVFWPAT